jgi:hypothetical protein
MVMVVGGPDTKFVRLLRKRPNRWGYTSPTRHTEDTKWVPDHTNWPDPSYEYPKPPSEWPDGSLDVSAEWSYAKECCVKVGTIDLCRSGTYSDTTRQTFQSLQLLVQSNAQTHAFEGLYLVGGYASGQHMAETKLETGEDDRDVARPARLLAGSSENAPNGNAV